MHNISNIDKIHLLVVVYKKRKYRTSVYIEKIRIIRRIIKKIFIYYSSSGINKALGISREFEKSLLK
jgi:hypothetical protein